MAEEGLRKTKNDLIYIGCPIPFDVEDFLENLDDLMLASYSNKKQIRTLVAKMVSTYHPADMDPVPEKDRTYQNLISGSDV